MQSEINQLMTEKPALLNLSVSTRSSWTFKSAGNTMIEREVDKIQLKLSWYRWLILLFYILSGCTVAGLAITLTPASTLIADAYNVGLEKVSLCTLSSGILAVPMYFISMKLYTVLPAAWMLRLGSVLLLVGCWMRQLSTFNGNEFWPIVTGAFINSTAGPIIYSAQNIICNRWFGDDERGIATALSSLSNPIGTIVVFVQTGILYKGIKPG